MHVQLLRVHNFRNYDSAAVHFSPGRNIVIGDNARGKTNLLEAVEICSTGKSYRADKDFELILRDQPGATIEVSFRTGSYDEAIAIEYIASATQTKSGDAKVRKIIKVNGVVQPSVRGLLGKLPVVSFKSADLNLLRSGPRFRRDWIDGIAVRLRPAFHDTLSNLAKALAQRNRLLRIIFEQGRLTESDQEQLYVWDKQLAKYSTLVTKERLRVLAQLLPLAEEYQAVLSRRHEKLSINYSFAAGEPERDLESAEESTDDSRGNTQPAAAIARMEDVELARLLLQLMKEKRHEEIRRKVSLVGPHRDDLLFQLNDFDAVSYASQGQQRSIVLALKLAELKLVTERINDSPILLLDDVLAELDVNRQALLMSAVDDNMQTIVTTTGLSGFGREWLEGARILSVEAGPVIATEDFVGSAEKADLTIMPNHERVN
ncbi:MAG: DNA replication and repair protein RecF [Candidatus Obscuribacterales bacterium]|nr:DNA replication and repair protein RecF [Candidatus Obscuribacterales bacterium]